MGLERLTQLTITLTEAIHDPAGDVLEAAGVLRRTYGLAPLVELTFDDGHQGLTIDARPHLPLVLYG